MNDESASRQFYEVVWPHRAAALRTAQNLSRNSADAEDLVQETLLKAFRAIHQYKPGTSPKAWLMTILRNAWVDRVRSRAALPAQVSLEKLLIEPAGRHEQPDLPTPDDPEAIMSQFGDEQILDSLRDLPDEIRWTLLLVVVEGLDHADAAEVLQVPVGTIKSRAHRGRAMLWKTLLPLAKERRLLKEPAPTPGASRERTNAE